MAKRIKKLVKRSLFSIPALGKIIENNLSLSAENESLKDHINKLDKTLIKAERMNQDFSKELAVLKGKQKKHKTSWPVFKKDILFAEISKSSKRINTHHAKPPYKLNWVVPPMDSYTSGGHIDIFRTIKFLESKGYKNSVYFYDALNRSSLSEIRLLMKKYPRIKADIFYNEELSNCDALVATNWFTAYPVYNSRQNVKKFYYVQDFEPYFDPAGSFHILAENTYRFGLHGITMGKWLAKKLSKEYGMTCDYINIGFEDSEYKLINTKKRKKVLFYARPMTPRRGFELGLLALEAFHKKHPEYEIIFVGWDTSNYEVGFPYTNKGILNHRQLNSLYNECATGLVLSFTNMSLLPLEMLAAGCGVVINDLEQTRMVEYSSLVYYAASTPSELAEAIFNSIKQTDPEKIGQEMAKITQNLQWDIQNKKIEQVIRRELS